jgi:AraC-like DNA-binding protein
MSLAYRELAPPPTLSSFVERFWTLTWRDDGDAREIGPWRVLPDGCLDLIFDLAPKSRPHHRWVGTMTRTLEVALEPRVDRLGIRFRPGRVRAFLGISASELTDKSTSIDDDDHWRDALSTAGRLAEARPERRLGILERRLIAHLAKTPVPADRVVEACVDQIRMSRGRCPIGSLERMTGISARQLERRFRTAVGLSPKRFARVVRFQNVLATAPSISRGGWADAALDLGYSDQAHLINEVRALAGMSPTALQWR